MFEQGAHKDSPRRLDIDLDAPLEQQHDPMKHSHSRQPTDHCSRRQASPKKDQDLSNAESLNFGFKLPPEVNAAQVCRQQFTSNAATAFLPSQNRDSVLWDTGPHWAQLIPDLVNRDHVLDSSIQALCLMQISPIKQERWLLRSSLTFYDKALQAIKGALIQPTKAFRPEIFAAAMALATYELLQGSSVSENRGWMYHIEGASSYLNAFPELDVCSFSHQLSFHFLETIYIFDALGARRPSCFSTSIWWRSTVDRFGDHLYGALLRMITDLPTLLQQCDESMKLPSSVEANEKRSTLLQMAFHIETAFRDWFQTMTAQVSLCQHKDTSIRQETSDSESEIAQPELSFPNLYTARLLLLYRSSMILLYESICDLLRNPEACTEPANFKSSGRRNPLYDNSVLKHYMELSHAFAVNIRQSVRFCLQPEVGVIGKTLILLPLWIARNHLEERNDRQARCCSDLLDQLGQSNLTFGLHVRKSTSYNDPR